MSLAHYQEQCAQVMGAQTHDPTWLRDLRAKAHQHFCDQGFPERRAEDWKYTPVAPWIKKNFVREGADRNTDFSQCSTSLLMPSYFRMVFVNGRFVPEQSVLDGLPEAVRLCSLREAVADETQQAILQRVLGQCAGAEKHPFAALNGVLMDDGVYLSVPDGVNLPQPIHIVSCSNKKAGGQAFYPRHVIALGQGAHASVFESYLGCGNDKAYFTNTVTEIDLAAEAHLSHCKIQEESTDAYHVAGIHTQQQAGSVFRSSVFALGAALARHDIVCHLNQPHAECFLDGLYITRDKQHSDFHTQVQHVAPKTVSREFYKGILDDRSRAVFNGKVIVQPEAIQTEAQQTNKNIVLSQQAEVDTKPELQIYTDDVSCAHGATVGRLDEKSLYYLRARGLGEAQARQLLLFGFAREMIDAVPVAAFKPLLEQRVSRALASQTQG